MKALGFISRTAKNNFFFSILTVMMVLQLYMYVKMHQMLEVHVQHTLTSVYEEGKQQIRDLVEKN